MADEKMNIAWGTAQLVMPRVLEANAFRVAAESGMPIPTSFPATILFDKSQIALQGAGAPLSGTWAGALCLPFVITPAPGEVWFKSDLRFNFTGDARTRFLLVAQLDGRAHVEEFSYGETDAPGTYRDAEAQPAVVTKELHREFVHKAATLPAQHYALNLFLTAERQTPRADALITIESLEININPNFRG